MDANSLALAALILNLIGTGAVFIKLGYWSGKVDQRLNSVEKRQDEHADEIAALQNARFRR